MRALIGSGVDGIITDYPDRLREVVADVDMKLPRSFGLQSGRQAGVPAFTHPRSGLCSETQELLR